MSQSVVSRPLKEHKKKWSTLTLECKELLLKLMVRGTLADHLTQLKVVTGTLNAQKFQDEILESGVRSPLDSLRGQNMVLRVDIAKPHCTRIIEEYKNQQDIASLPWSSLLPDLNPI